VRLRRSERCPRTFLVRFSRRFTPFFTRPSAGDFAQILLPNLLGFSPRALNPCSPRSLARPRSSHVRSKRLLLPGSPPRYRGTVRQP